MILCNFVYLFAAILIITKVLPIFFEREQYKTE